MGPLTSFIPDLLTQSQADEAFSLMLHPRPSRIACLMDQWPPAIGAYRWIRESRTANDWAIDYVSRLRWDEHVRALGEPSCTRQSADMWLTTYHIETAIIHLGTGSLVGTDLYQVCPHQYTALGDTYRGWATKLTDPGRLRRNLSRWLSSLPPYWDTISIPLNPSHSHWYVIMVSRTLGIQIHNTRIPTTDLTTATKAEPVPTDSAVASMIALLQAAWFDLTHNTWPLLPGSAMFQPTPYDCGVCTVLHCLRAPISMHTAPVCRSFRRWLTWLHVRELLLTRQGPRTDSADSAGPPLGEAPTTQYLNPASLGHRLRPDLPSDANHSSQVPQRSPSP